MSTRIRLIYSKRGGACFVPHIALAQMFTRSAARAGITLEMTQGFSPRAKISFGPELPAGVVALNEPVDIFTQGSYPDVVALMNASLPEGFTVSRAIYPSEGSPNLGKSCKHAEYLLRTTNGHDITQHAVKFWANSVMFHENADGWTHLIISEPAQNPIGGLIRSLIEGEIISGWHEINAVRIAIGIYDKVSGSVKL